MKKYVSDDFFDELQQPDERTLTKGEKRLKI